MPKCKNCMQETDNPKFCSRSCSATVSNSLYPKVKTKIFLCKKCGERCLQKRKFCQSCNGKDRKNDMTLAEAIYKKHHKSSAFALVRWRARSVVSHLPKICIKCEYDKHVEVCHIRSIASFPEDTLLSIINSINNLILLCPNCHWEHDNH